MSEWIKCSESMPEYNHVLTWGAPGFDIARWDGNGWYDSYGVSINPKNITHWQPLPEPPT